MKRIDFSEYANEYDFMAKNNPAYSQIEKKVISIFSTLFDKKKYIIGDFGAGTGNFSLLLKQNFPNYIIVGLEYDSNFILKFKKKTENVAYEKLFILQGDILNPSFRSNSLDAILMVHVLNLLSDQQRAIQKIYEILKPNGYLVIFDVGRKMNIWDWGIYMALYSLKKNGILKTIQLFKNTRLVAKQNKIFSKGQKNGTYELNSLEEFKKKFLSFPFQVIEESDRFYRSIDNYLLLKKIK